MNRFYAGRTVTRAKVYVSDVTRSKWSESIIAEKVIMRFVNGNDPDTENAKFWEASPSAEPISITIVNPGAQGVLEVGKEYYIDFIEALRETVIE